MASLSNRSRCLLSSHLSYLPPRLSRSYQAVTLSAPWNFVHGKRVAPVDSDGLSFQHHEPATGKDVCAIPESGPSDVDTAVASAHDGFQVWSGMSGIERGRILVAAGQRIRSSGTSR